MTIFSNVLKSSGIQIRYTDLNNLINFYNWKARFWPGTQPAIRALGQLPFAKETSIVVHDTDGISLIADSLHEAIKLQFRQMASYEFSMGGMECKNKNIIIDPERNNFGPCTPILEIGVRDYTPPPISTRNSNGDTIGHYLAKKSDHNANKSPFDRYSLMQMRYVYAPNPTLPNDFGVTETDIFCRKSVQPECRASAVFAIFWQYTATLRQDKACTEYLSNSTIATDMEASLADAQVKLTLAHWLFCANHIPTPADFLYPDIILTGHDSNTSSALNIYRGQYKLGSLVLSAPLNQAYKNVTSMMLHADGIFSRCSAKATKTQHQTQTTSSPLMFSAMHGIARGFRQIISEKSNRSHAVDYTAYVVSYSALATLYFLYFNVANDEGNNTHDAIHQTLWEMMKLLTVTMSLEAVDIGLSNITDNNIIRGLVKNSVFAYNAITEPVKALSNMAIGFACEKSTLILGRKFVSN